jgi:predicted DNA-binding protein
MTRPTKSAKGPVVKLSVSISPEAAAKLEAFCKRNERGKSWVLEKLITDHLDKME